ncbi:MAG TPA: ATP-dependent metallopeptidase FtsH/Yme1/Tma family protein, partial [Ktedonobacteraceae bacterium]
MEDKSDRRFKPEDYGRHHSIKFYKHCTVPKFLKEHKQPVGASVLIVIIFVLLIGIFSQLQAPTTSKPPSGVTVVDYGTFVAQVKTSNVLLVTMRGNEITGKVHHTLQGQTCDTPAGTAITDPFISMQWWFSGFSPASCTIFTYLPARSDSALLPLLLSH